jgi:hypothetical protein
VSVIKDKGNERVFVQVERERRDDELSYKKRLWINCVCGGEDEEGEKGRWSASKQMQ